MMNHILAYLGITNDSVRAKSALGRGLKQDNKLSRIAHHISISFYNLDQAIRQIADAYHQLLVAQMRLGNTGGEHFANSQTRLINPFVHAFFLNIGSARDYLGTLIAHRIGLDTSSVNSMGRLFDAKLSDRQASDALLRILIDSGNLEQAPKSKSKLRRSGWLHKSSSIRDRIVHNIPYGAEPDEYYGAVVSINDSKQFFRFNKQIIWNKKSHDLLEFINLHYSQANELFMQLANASGYPVSPVTITDDDIDWDRM